MKNIKFAFFLISCGGLCGCHNLELTNMDRLFTKTPEIKLTIQSSNIKSDDIGVPVYYACVDSLLIVSEMFSAQFITVYNVNNGEVLNRFAAKGRGPNEFLGIGGIYFSNDYLIMQVTMPHRMAFVHKNDLLNPQPDMQIVTLKEDGLFYLRMAPVSQGLFMGTAMFSDKDIKNQFVFVDMNGEYLYPVDSYPLNQQLKDTPNYDMAFGFQGNLRPSVDGHYALYSGVLHGVLKFFKFEDNTPKKIKEYIVAFPKFSSRANPENDSYGVMASEESIAGTLSVAVSDDSYYVLFSSQPRKYESDVIFVFDLDGKPMHRIRLNEHVETIVYSKKDNSLLAYWEREGHPRIDIIKLP